MGGLTSLQVCMDSTDWLQGTIHEDDNNMMMMMDDSSSSPTSAEILTCSRPLVERRLRPPHDQALKCPRCDSAHTKFCYYNNYSLSQPRYFCKTCRRYWTKGGTLRNIPVGGGCRKNKKVSSKKPIHEPLRNPPMLSSSDLQLNMQFTHLSNFLGGSSNNNNNSNDNMNSNSFMGTNNNHNNNPRPIDFMDSKYEVSYHGGYGGDHMGFGTSNFCSPFGIGMSTLDHHHGGGGVNPNFMLPYDQDHGNHGALEEEMKPNTKLLALEWQDQGCTSDAGRDSSFGYINGGLGSWTGLINGYGSSANNPLV